MRICSLFIFWTIFNVGFTHAQSTVEWVEKANALYEQDKKQEAKLLYEKAALLNNADAHFYLAYRYALADNDRVFHFKQAALKGHGEAMSYFLDEAFFRQNNLFKADPFSILAVYEKGKQANPVMQFYNEAGRIRSIKYAAEAGPFDANAFVKKYDIDTGKMNQFYSVWEIAEAASQRKGRFADVDNKLLLQLISRGGGVPAELMIAIDTAYQVWKGKQQFEFNICHYVTSGYGMGYCARRGAADSEVQIHKRLSLLTARLKNGSGKYLKQSYKATANFLEAKVWNEELHGGSGYAAWATESLVKQKNEFVQLIENLNSGKLPKGVAEMKDNDARLNAVYNDVLMKLRKKPLTDFNTEVNADGLRKTQRLWIPYRDATAALLYAMRPDVKKQQWLNWITEQRIRELAALLQYQQ
ncbi:lysozyme inhibitor LprI family protein [Niabella sp. 22666]|uniref:lysozyme inhibitor LprI family protein n=1 Tax=Niabella sp. 22666 TaxID=3453954 RepID=UPI003F86D56B